jgi:hypothetical protein
MISLLQGAESRRLFYAEHWPVGTSPTPSACITIIDLLDPVFRETGLTDVLAPARGYPTPPDRGD